MAMTLVIIIGVVLLVAILLTFWTLSNLQNNFGKTIAILCLLMIVGFAVMPLFR